MSDIINDKDLEKVNGGYKEEYSFDVADKFQESDGSIYYVNQKKSTNDIYSFVSTIKYNASTGKTYYILSDVNLLRSLKYLGNDKAGYEAAKKIATY